MKIEQLEIGDRALKAMKRKKIETVEDCINYLPRSYIDGRHVYEVGQAPLGEYVVVKGVVTRINVFEKLSKAILTGPHGEVELIWFKGHSMASALQLQATYYACGIIQKSTFHQTRDVYEMAVPLYVDQDANKMVRLLPKYPSITGLSNGHLEKIMLKALDAWTPQTETPALFESTFQLLPLKDAWRTLHFPSQETDLVEAERRLRAETFYRHAREMEQWYRKPSKSEFVVHTRTMADAWIVSLPFELTEGQREAYEGMYRHLCSERRLHALVQGDVGCGKTMVAFLAVLLAAENGWQSAVVAPTHVLAKQHYEEFVERTKDWPVRVAFLSGDTKGRERKAILQALAAGEIDVLFGTHALFSMDVIYSRLGMIIVDEEHRFGVQQREAIREKGESGVHFISMTATPIPRTLALALYGDVLQLFEINTLPKGRLPIKTGIRTEKSRAYNGILQELQKGRQAYVLCPMIEEGEEGKGLNELAQVEEEYVTLQQLFEPQGYQVAKITGRMKSQEVQETIQRFKEGEAHILVATTIVEVGVNVPNATLIAILNAERFGMAQLHQLRGRVGRSYFQSYCVLVTEKAEDPKLIAMCQYSQGSDVASHDLKLRGVGTLTGTMQSGKETDSMLVFQYPDEYRAIREWIKEQTMSSL